MRINTFRTLFSKDRMNLNCTNCLKDFSKPDSEVRRTKSGNHFCCRSCAQVFNNKLHPKKSRSKTCKSCTNLIRSNVTYCRDCFELILSKNLDHTTLGDAMSRTRQDGGKYSKIRARARKLMKDVLGTCSNCGYDKHTEVCHIRPIKSFPLETPISEINSRDNLICLCPNCHWELDKGLLKLDTK